MTPESARQRLHYERIHDDYERHYYDSTSMAFRERFLYDAMFDGLDLNGRRVADLASGSGHNSLAILQRFPRAEVVGFDISETACRQYRATVGAEAYQFDLISGGDAGMAFDVAIIVGGLHHCVSNLDATFRTIANLLCEGGLLLMYEPNSEYVLEGVRKFWYRRDRYFDAATEHALAHDRIARMAAKSGLVPLRCHYAGGPAYFLIQNSLLFRIPVPLKRYLAPPLFALETAYNRLPWKSCFPTFIACWRKT
ncbi:MAG TPA: class I SAM-dependent methyltransferase [Casimicrobiaceae bacterium]|nr:class I SAM-dependent methyltransferase [Casimicrobiaceae bacterium]